MHKVKLFKITPIIIIICFVMGALFLFRPPHKQAIRKHVDTVKLNSPAYTKLMARVNDSLHYNGSDTKVMTINKSNQTLEQDFDIVLKSNSSIKAVCLANTKGIVTFSSDKSYHKKDYSLDSFFQTIISGNSADSYSILVPDIYGESSYIAAIAVSDADDSHVNGVLFAYVSAN